MNPPQLLSWSHTVEQSSNFTYVQFTNFASFELKNIERTVSEGHVSRPIHGGIKPHQEPLKGFESG